jgi:radical SAM enzyme (TIGR01210 family)
MDSRQPFDSAGFERGLDTLLAARAVCPKHSLTDGLFCLLVFLIEAGNADLAVNDAIIVQVQRTGLLDRRSSSPIHDLATVKQEVLAVLKKINRDDIPEASTGRSLAGKLREALNAIYPDYDATLQAGKQYLAIALPRPEDKDRVEGWPYLPQLRPRTVEEVRGKPAATLTLLHDVLDRPMLEEIQRLLTHHLGTVNIAACQTPSTAVTTNSALIVLVTINFLSRPAAVFEMGRCSTQSYSLRIALIGTDVADEDLSQLEGFEIRRIISPLEVIKTMLQVSRSLGFDQQIDFDAGRVDEFIARCKQHLGAPTRAGLHRTELDRGKVLRLPREILVRASTEPLAARLMAQSVSELHRGNFKVYLRDEIYKHDTEALQQLVKGDSYVATHPGYANPRATHSAIYQRYISEQCEAARERHVKVNRIYIQNGKAFDDDLLDEMRRLQESKVGVWVASTAQLDNGYHDDFVLIGTRMLGLGWPPRGPMQYSLYDFVNQQEISKYQQYFESLKMASTEYIPENRFETAAYREPTSVRIGQEPSERLMVVLRTNGCSYDQKKTGCRMCDFSAHAIDRKIHQITAADLSRQLMAELDRHLKNSIQQIDLLTLGNFLNAAEVPEDFQVWAMKRFSELTSIRKVVIESRCNYVTVENLRRLKSALRADQILELGVGVESSNRYIRNNVLNKGLEWATLAETMKKARAADVAFMAYLLIKPQTLSEREAIDDAVTSARDVAGLAEECGVPLRIAYEPVFVTEHTDLEQHFIHFKNYEILNLWSVIEVLKRTEAEILGQSKVKDITIFVGLSDENLSGNRKPRSCELCTATLTDAINKYNASNDIAVFHDLPSCCYADWAQKVGKHRFDAEYGQRTVLA